MKKVFNNAELCHVWASESQSQGRNSNGSMFFESNIIFSYGRHYVAAVIHTNNKGEKIALVNSYNYSMTTAKQLGHVRSALNGRMTYVSSETPDCIDSTIDALKQSVKTLQVEQRNVRKKYSVLESIQDSIKNINDLLSFQGKASFYLSHDEMEEILSLDKLKQQKIKDSETKKHAAMLAEYLPEVELWKTGQNTKSIPYKVQQIVGDIVRLNNKGEVETLRGATVPYSHAMRLLSLYVNGKVRQGERVGHYTVDQVQGEKMKIGCHLIDVKQAMQALNFKIEA